MSETSRGWKVDFFGIVATVAVIAAVVALCSGFLWFMNAYGRWKSTGHVFMPEEVSVPVVPVHDFDRSDYENHTVKLPDSSGSCIVMPGARLLRLRGEEGYVLVQVNQPDKISSIMRDAACKDGTLTVMSEDRFWGFALRENQRLKDSERDSKIREIERRLLQGK